MLWALASLIVIDAAMGLEIFMREHGIIGGDVNHKIADGLLSTEEKKAVQVEVVDNDRVPEALKSNELLRKLFMKGWKSDAFNMDDQIAKQISAVSVIFALVYFSTASLIMDNATNPVTVFTLIYSASALWSFLNFAHVRDMNTYSKNVTPVVLGLLAILHIMVSQRSLTFDGMALTLLADVYFALRFTDDSDKIEFSMLERFSLESWTQGAFDAENKLTLQMVSISFIFAQMFFALTGVVSGRAYQGLFLAFAFARMFQFMNDSLSGVRAFQSNMTCVLLAVLGLT